MLRPAGFWIRLVAYTLDQLIWMMTYLLPLYAVVNRYRRLEELLLPLGILLYYTAFIAPVGVLAYRVILTSRFGGPVGKRLCGIKVVDERGDHLGLRMSLFRNLVGYIVSWLFFGLGFLWIAKDVRQQGWHDQISGTSVVHDRPRRTALGVTALLILLFLTSFVATSIVYLVKSNTVLQRDIQTLIEEIVTPPLENQPPPATIEPPGSSII